MNDSLAANSSGEGSSRSVELMEEEEEDAQTTLDPKQIF